MRRLLGYIVLLLSAIFLAFSCEKPTPAPTPGPDEPDDPVGPVTKSFYVKAMSFNIRYVNTIDLGDLSWDARREPCVKMINEIKPDFIGMQEPRLSQTDYLNGRLSDYTLHRITIASKGGPSQVTKEAQTGYTAIYFLTQKYTLINSGYFWLGETPEKVCTPFESNDTQVRTCVWVQLKHKASGKYIYFFTAHVPYDPDSKNRNTSARTKCVDLIVSKMKEIAGENEVCLVTGDFNCSYDEKDDRRVSLQGFYDWMSSARDKAQTCDDVASPGIYSSFNGFEKCYKVAEDPRYNLDHIFYRKCTANAFYTVVSEKYGVKFLSDHYPIYCDFRITYQK